MDADIDEDGFVLRHQVVDPLWQKINFKTWAKIWAKQSS